MSNSQKGKLPDGFKEHIPSGKNRSGPSMKERLLAQRQAQEAGVVDDPEPAKPKAKSAGKPIVKKASSRAVSKASPKANAESQEQPSKKAAAPKPVRRVTRAESDAKIEAAEEIAGASINEAKEKERPSARTPRSSARRSSAPARSGSRRRGADDGDEEENEGGSRRRGGAPKKEKSKLVPALGGLAILALVGAGVWKFTQGGDTQAANPTENLPNPETAGVGDPSAGDTEVKEPDQEALDKEAADKEAADKAAAAEAAKEDQPEESGAPKESGPPEIKRYAKSGRQIIGIDTPDSMYDANDPSEVKVAELTQFGMPPGVTEEEWTAILETMEVAITDESAAGQRAAKALEGKYPVAAVPALINGLTSLDYTQAISHETGFVIQRTLMMMCNGRNADWFMGFNEEPNKAQLANGRSIELWHNAWAKNVEDPTYWDKFAGNTKAAQREKEGEPEEDASDDLLDMLDD